MKKLTPVQICGLIQYKTGLTIPQFAKRIGVARGTVYNAINDAVATRSRKNVHHLIAEAVGKPLAELWPNRPTLVQ